MATKTEIANLALSHLGVGKEIGNLDTEKSEEATACRRFYVTARDAALRDFPWPFAKKFANLALVADPPTETDEWAYSYRYPSDCVFFRRIPSGIINETADQRIVYTLGRDSEGELIYTNQALAKAEYTFREDNPGRYPPDFQIAHSMRLAALIAPWVTGGDPFKLGEKILRQHSQEIAIALRTAQNEEQGYVEPDSEFIRGRT